MSCDEGFTIGVSQMLTLSGTSQPLANPTSSGVRQLRLLADKGAYVKICPAASPVAATNADFPLAPNIPEIINVGAGSVKVTALQLGTGGSLWVTEVS